MDKLQEELNQANNTIATHLQTIKDRDQEVYKTPSANCYRRILRKLTRGIQKVLRQILKNTLFMNFTKLFFYIVSIQFITLL